MLVRFLSIRKVIVDCLGQGSPTLSLTCSWPIQRGSMITTADRTHWSSVFRFEVQVFVCHILYFYKNHVLPSGQFPNITHTQQVMYMFAITYCCEQLFFKMNQAYTVLTIVKSSLVWCASFVNLFHLTLILHVFFVFLWLQTSDISLINYNCYFVNLAVFFLFF